MTYREFYTAVKELPNVSTELAEFADKAIVALNNKNEKRKTGESKTAKANAVYREKVVALLTENGAMTAKQIAKALTTPDEEISTQKVGGIIRSFDEGVIVVADGKDEKKNRVKVYSLAQ